jgi:hypothetical protein
MFLPAEAPVMSDGPRKFDGISMARRRGAEIESVNLSANLGCGAFVAWQSRDIYVKS